MFLKKYLDDFYLNLVLDNYDEKFIATLDEDNFRKVYDIFRKYNFYFINDIILNYMEIFMLDSKEVEDGIMLLKKELGKNFIYLIGNDMSYLNKIIDYD